MHKDTDILQQIKKYLDGELDARAMHKLERRAQDDPFLMDALEGYQNTPVNMDAGLDELDNRLQQRTVKKQGRIVPWRTMGIAASVLLLLGLGILWFVERAPSVTVQKKVVLAPPVHEPETPQSKIQVSGDSTVNAAKVDKVITDQQNRVAINRSKVKYLPLKVIADDNAAPAPPAVNELQPGNEDKVFKSKDTTPLNEMVVMDYTARKNANDLADEKPVSAAADSAFRPTSKNLIAKVKNDTLREVRIKGTDIAKLNENQNGYNAQTYNQDMYGQNMLYYKPRQAQPKSDISITAAVSVGNAIHGYLTKRLPVTGGIIPFTPVLHGKMVKGMVKAYGEPVAYASVKIKGTAISTLTDAKGRFTLYTVPDSAILQVSAEGYATKEIKVNKRGLQVIAIHQVINDTAAASANENSLLNDLQPRPSTGWDDFDDYLRQNAVSPDRKKGTVKLSFSVGADNSLSNFKVVKSVSPQTDNAAIKLIKGGPAWYSPSDDKAQTVIITIKFHITGK